MNSSQFPKSHLIISIVLGVSLCSFVIAKFSDDPEGDRFTTETVLLDLPAIGEIDNQAPVSAAASPDPLPSRPVPTNTTTKKVRVAPGDNLALLFQKQGLSPQELHRLVTTKPLGSRLKEIFPGHELRFTVDEQNTLVKLTYSPGPLEVLEFTRIGDAFEGVEVVSEPERVTAYKHGTIDHSLFIASQRAGLDDSLTMRLAHIFQWDIDFVLDIRAGDEFYVLFQELYLGDRFIGYGKILAAEFINQGESYKAVLYTDTRSAESYYDPRGLSMKKDFLRAPVSFTRISSNFNLRRKHPLWKRTMPHRGIDYVAPRGTPILASGSGKVLQANRSKANGNFVVIRHGEQFVTKYLHLSKFARGVRSNARVEQGQTIGYVGATGWATAPHLHYEFLVNGVHKNPRTVKLPDADPVPNSEIDRFSQLSIPLFSLLDNYKQQIQLALGQ